MKRLYPAFFILCAITLSGCNGPSGTGKSVELEKTVSDLSGEIENTYKLLSRLTMKLDVLEARLSELEKLPRTGGDETCPDAGKNAEFRARMIEDTASVRGRLLLIEAEIAALSKKAADLAGAMKTGDADEEKKLVYDGTIEKVDENVGVIINLGTDQGVANGDVFDVYRGGEKIGSIKVLFTMLNKSAGADPTQTMKVGDKVIKRK